MTYRLLLLFCLNIHCATAAFAEDIVVVISQKSIVNRISRDEVIDIFMGRNRQLSAGVTAEPLDLQSMSIERENFYFRLTGKSLSEINAYWARLHFTGRATPPALVRSQEEAIQRIVDNHSALAYVNRSKINSQVKVIFELNEK